MSWEPNHTSHQFSCCFIGWLMRCMAPTACGMPSCWILLLILDEAPSRSIQQRSMMMMEWVLLACFAVTVQHARWCYRPPPCPLCLTACGGVLFVLGDTRLSHSLIVCVIAARCAWLDSPSPPHSLSLSFDGQIVRLDAALRSSPFVHLPIPRFATTFRICPPSTVHCMRTPQP